MLSMLTEELATMCRLMRRAVLVIVCAVTLTTLAGCYGVPVGGGFGMPYGGEDDGGEGDGMAGYGMMPGFGWGGGWGGFEGWRGGDDD